MAFAPDSQTLAIIQGDDYVEVQSAVDSSQISEIRPANSPESLVFAADGGRLVVVEAEQPYGRVSSWDPHTGQLLTSFLGTNGVYGMTYGGLAETAVAVSPLGDVYLWGRSEILPLAGRTDASGEVSRVVFSQDGSRLATAHVGGDIHLWDLQDGSHLGVLEGHIGKLTNADFSYDNRRLVSAGSDGTVRLWDLETYDEDLALPEMTLAVAFAPSGESFATGRVTGLTHVWDLEGVSLAEFTGHSKSVTDVTFDLDGSNLATASADGTAKIWDLETGEAVSTLAAHLQNLFEGRSPYEPRVLRSVTFDYEGLRVATIDDNYVVRVWRAFTGELIHEIPGPATSATFSPDGRSLATTSPTGGRDVWSSVTGDLLQSRERPISKIVVHENGERLASIDAQGRGWLWNSRSGELVSRLGTGLVQLQFSKGGDILAATTHDRRVTVWNARTGLRLADLPDDVSRTDRMLISPDGGSVVVLEQTGVARLWDISDGSGSTSIGADIQDAAFGAEGEWLATLHENGVVRTWSGRTGEPLTALEARTNVAGVLLYVTDIATAPLGRGLATASTDGSIRLWNAETGSIIAVSPSPGGSVQELSFSPDGRLLVVGTRSGVHLRIISIA